MGAAAPDSGAEGGGAAAPDPGAERTCGGGGDRRWRSGAGLRGGGVARWRDG